MNEKGYARITDPETSHMAAAAVDTTKGRQMVIDTLDRLGPSSQEDVSLANGIPGSGILTPRFAPLKRDGLIVVIGRKKNSKNRTVDVYALTEAGRSKVTQRVA